MRLSMCLTNLIIVEELISSMIAHGEPRDVVYSEVVWHYLLSKKMIPMVKHCKITHWIEDFLKNMELGGHLPSKDIATSGVFLGLCAWMFGTYQ